MTADFWNQRRVLITGGAGFLGSWTAKLLADAGAVVVGISREPNRDCTFVRMGLGERARLVAADVGDRLSLQRVLADHAIEAVFHLAAQPIVGAAMKDPVGTFQTNIAGTWNLLEACRGAGSVRRIVLASTDRVYGSSPQPWTEESALAARQPYDVSKIAAELIADSYAKAFRVPVAIARLSNFYGGGDLNFSRLVPGTIRSILAGQAPVIRSDGTFTRDYLYVEDVVRACALLAEKLENSALWGDSFNFSDQVSLSVLELTERILALMDRRDLRPVILNEAAGETRHCALSSAKARRELGWSPRFSVEEGLRKTIEWYREHGDQAGP
jgi:CDP-glucose 4,6-dehydratase